MTQSVKLDIGDLVCAKQGIIATEEVLIRDGFGIVIGRDEWYTDQLEVLWSNGEVYLLSIGTLKRMI